MGRDVTVILRCRDKFDTIEATFASIRAQTVPSEIVGVDSGSTDGTLEVARCPADVLEHIAPDEFSFGRALNVGAAAAHGTIHAAVSAHRRFPRRDSLERALEHLGHNDVARVCGSLDRSDGRPLPRLPIRAQRIGSPAGDSATRAQPGAPRSGGSIGSTRT
jgi:rhamnosyltransferase